MLFEFICGTDTIYWSVCLFVCAVVVEIDRSWRYVVSHSNRSEQSGVEWNIAKQSRAEEIEIVQGCTDWNSTGHDRKNTEPKALEQIKNSYHQTAKQKCYLHFQFNLCSPRYWHDFNFELCGP